MEITYEDLLEIIFEVNTRLHRDIKKAFDDERLENYLQTIGMADLIPKKETEYDTFSHGKILIIGDSRVREHEIIGCCKSLGIEKDRLDLKLSYQEAEKFNFEHLQYNPNTRLILFGPIPHSTKGKDEYSSIINKIENTDGYPKVVRMISGDELKITKSNLKKTLKKEINSGYLVV
ncbi:MAG: hypothetical protein ACTHWZ_01710 [Peptoniphilaceae bacterium]